MEQGNLKGKQIENMDNIVDITGHDDKSSEQIKYTGENSQNELLGQSKEDTELNELSQNSQKSQINYIRFIFYEIKLEIIHQDFIRLIHISNIGEVVIWLVSFLLYFSTPDDFPHVPEGQRKIKYKNSFIFIHLFHVRRALLGVVLFFGIPKTYKVVEKLKAAPQSVLESKTFEFLLRQKINKILKKMKKKKFTYYAYAALTLFNFIVDIVDFLVILSVIGKGSSDSKVVLLAYLIIAFLYIVIDLSFIFFGFFIKYLLPYNIIYNVTGMFNKYLKCFLKKFKLTKEFVDDTYAHDGGNTNIQLPMLKNEIMSNDINEEINKV